MIPEEAFKAATDAYRETLTELRLREGGGFKVGSQVNRSIRAALQAAYPIMLSHERQQTADAHRDAIVNRDTVDRLEGNLADAWDEGYGAGKSDEFAADKGFTGYHANPYRSQG